MTIDVKAAAQSQILFQLTQESFEVFYFKMFNE